MEREEAAKVDFFKDMEKNILRKISDAKLSDGIGHLAPLASASSADEAEARYNSSTKGMISEDAAKLLISSMDVRRRPSLTEPGRRIRTISTMDGIMMCTRIIIIQNCCF
jgi:hypothetical protein